MDIYPAVNFMWKWDRPKKGLFLSLCTTMIIVMYAIFKINPIISECTCDIYNVHPIYYFTPVNIQITPIAVSIGTESQIF